jgi:hypothetical protein
MCRAFKVLCVASDEASLRALRRAVVAADWELTAGATNETDALGLIDQERPQAMVAFGDHARLVALTRERFPAMRIVTDRPTVGATLVASSADDVRELLRASGRPRGPVRSPAPSDPLSAPGRHPPQGPQPNR